MISTPSSAAAKRKTRVGVVGEIYVKYSSLGNNGLEKFLRTQDCEYMLPGIMGFVLFKIDNRIEDHHLYGGSLVKLLFCKALISSASAWKRR